MTEAELYACVLSFLLVNLEALRIKIVLVTAAQGLHWWSFANLVAQSCWLGRRVSQLKHERRDIPSE